MFQVRVRLRLWFMMHLFEMGTCFFFFFVISQGASPNLARINKSHHVVCHSLNGAHGSKGACWRKGSDHGEPWEICQNWSGAKLNRIRAGWGKSFIHLIEMFPDCVGWVRRVQAGALDPTALALKREWALMWWGGGREGAKKKKKNCDFMWSLVPTLGEGRRLVRTPKVGEDRTV